MTTRIVILGGGFGGIYAALGLDRAAAPEVEVTIINRDNFFLFTPMLTEVATGSIDTRHIVNPIRRLFRHVRFMEAEVRGLDFAGRVIHVELPTGAMRDAPYDHLVVALGSVSNSFKLPGVEEHALPMKTLADAITVRNRTIRRLEEADVTAEGDREELLTWVIAGGGLAGIELTGDLNDLIREAVAAYPTIHASDLRVVLLEAGPRLMPELSPSLAAFALRKLRERGVEVHLNAPVQEATSSTVTVGGVGTIRTRNLIWTAGVAPTPFVQDIGLPLHKGRIETDRTMRVPGHPGVWALGDVARIPDGRGGYHPPTAQHAVREGARLARNLLAVIDGKQPRPFRYRTMGMLATVGHHAGVGESFGIRFSGFFAWWIWRSYYIFRLPRIEKRTRVILDWTLDLFFTRDIVQLKMGDGDDRAGESIRHTPSER